MKKLIKLTGCILLAAILGLSSCVKTEIAPEVAQIRQAQVSKLNAEKLKTDADAQLVLANAAYREAEAALKEAEVAYTVANDAFRLQTNEATMNAAIVAQEALEMASQAALEASRLTYETNLASYERFITQGAFSLNVADLLLKYTTDMTALNGPGGLYSLRITANKDLAKAELMLDAVSTLSWDYLRPIIETNKTTKEAELAAAEAALAALEGVYDDPTTLEAAKSDLDTQIKDMADQLLALEVQKQEAKNVYDQADAAVTNAETVISDYELKVADTVSLVIDIAAENKKITDANNLLGPLNTDLALKNANLTADKNDNTAAMTAYNAKLALYNTAETNNNNALDLVASKTVLKTIADNNLAADPTNPTLIAAATAAATALTNATTAQGLTATALTSATGAKNAALLVVVGVGGTFIVPVNPSTLYSLNQSQIAVTGFADPLTAPSAGSAQGKVDAQLEIISDAQGVIADKEFKIEKKTDDIAFMQEDYDNAIANLQTLKKDKNDADNARKPINAEITAVTAMKADLAAVHSLLVAQLDALYKDNTPPVLDGVIVAQKVKISDLEKAIELLNNDLAANEYNKAAAMEEITRLEEYVAYLEAQIKAKEDSAAAYKKLLDEAIAAGA